MTTEEAARLEREYDKEMQPIQDEMDEMDEIYEKLTTDFEKAKANFFCCARGARFKKTLIFTNRH